MYKIHDYITYFGYKQKSLFRVIHSIQKYECLI